MSLIYLIVTFILYLFELIFLSEYSLFPSTFQQANIYYAIAVFAFLLLCHFSRKYFFRRGLFENNIPYYFDKMIYLFFICFVTNFFNIGIWFSIGILLPIIVTSLVKGPKPALLMLLSTFFIHISMYFFINWTSVKNGVVSASDFKLILAETSIAYIIFLIIVIFFGQLYKCGIEYEIENMKILEHFEERYMKLEMTKEEMKHQFDGLLSSSTKLEVSNKILSKSIAEFYTLNQIRQAIGSVLDIKELLKRLNDIIIGVLGVSYSTILLYDEKEDQLKIHSTNITDEDELAIFSEHLNDGLLMDGLNKGRSILENNVQDMQYVFTCGREINSLICIPLSTTTRKYGLVLVEHTYKNAFSDENVRLLSIITQQVGIVMENAELYLKMQELARKDGLTGIFNRQYFQEQLEIELSNAKQKNYPLSLVIFDIDRFKNFNDEYGHAFGDKVLISLVKAVNATLRNNDIMARYGGEEFTILLPGINLNEAYEKTEALRKLISTHVVYDNNISASVTVSFGVSSFDECATDEKALLSTADDALYESKAAGRNRVTTARVLERD